MPGIIYLHGFASGPASRKAQFFRERFGEMGIEVAAPDLSQGDFENLTISGQLGVIERVAAGAPVALMGSSMGGYLAALYAARHPEVRRAVLMAPAFGFPRRLPEAIGENAAAEWKRSGYLEVYHYGERANRRIGSGLLEDGARYENYPDAAQPMLIFHGKHDTSVPVRYSEEFAARRPNVRLEILDSDHELLNVLDHMWQMSRTFLVDAV